MLRLPVHRRADGRAYVPITEVQLAQLGARVGDRVIVHDENTLCSAEVQRRDGELVVHVHGGIEERSVRVRLPRGDQ